MSVNPFDVDIDNNENRCMICLENLSNEQQYSLPECSHTFHQNCIMQWFRSGSHKCPLCNNLGINELENTNNDYANNYMGAWFTTGKHKYKILRQYSRKKEAPQVLKKEIKKLKLLEENQKQLAKEMKEFKNKVGSFGELKKQWNKLRNKKWSLQGRIRQKKMGISNFNIVPIIIAKKVTLDNN